MFKFDGFEQELQKSMEKNLVATQVETNYKFKKIAKAVEYLSNAAALLEHNDPEASKELDNVLQDLVKTIK